MPANGVRISCRRNLLFANRSTPHRPTDRRLPFFLRNAPDRRRWRVQKTHDALSYTAAVMGHAARCRASRRGYVLSQRGDSRLTGAWLEPRQRDVARVQLLNSHGRSQANAKAKATVGDQEDHLQNFPLGVPCASCDKATVGDQKDSLQKLYGLV